MLKKSAVDCKQKVPDFPLWVKELQEVVQASSADVVDVGLGSDVDQALLNKVAARSEAMSQADLEALLKVPGFSLQHRWLKCQIANEKKTPKEKDATDARTAACGEYKPTVQKQIAAVLTKHCPFLMPKVCFPTDAAALKSTVFGPRHWLQTSLHHVVTVTPYCVAEIRLLVAGEYIAAGIDASKIPGDTLQKKLEYVSTDVGAVLSVCVNTNLCSYERKSCVRAVFAGPCVRTNTVRACVRCVRCVRGCVRPRFLGTLVLEDVSHSLL